MVSPTTLLDNRGIEMSRIRRIHQLQEIPGYSYPPFAIYLIKFNIGAEMLMMDQNPTGRREYGRKVEIEQWEV